MDILQIDAREAAALRRSLLAWFRKFRRDLPWRRTRDPYRIWISEIMLQQTRVAAVIPYYQRFLERFPDVRALAEAPEDDVLRLWSGLGYYSRARNLQAAAREIVAKHGGEFPREETAARALPGIGRYTSAAILSIAFGAKLAVLDGNVARLIARLGAARGDLREPKRWAALQNAADRLLATDAPGDWNQAVMELGATLCTPRAPQCLLCPVSKFCRARRLGLSDVIPEKRKKRGTVEIQLAAAVFRDSRARTILLPPPGKKREHVTAQEVTPLVSRMWHFPTIQVERDAQRELRRFLAALAPKQKPPANLEALPAARHAVTYRTITLLPFFAHVAKLPRIAGAKIVALDDFSSVPVSGLTRKIARAAQKLENDSKNKR